MEIAFNSKELRKQCESYDEATAAFGTEVAEKLIMRLADLMAHANAAEIFMGSPEFIGDALYIQLTEQSRMYFRD